MPSRKRPRHVGEYLADQLAPLVALFPEFSLQAFQRRRLPVPIHQPLGVAGSRVESRARRRVEPWWNRLGGALISRVLLSQLIQQRGVGGRGRVPLDVLPQMPSRIGKQTVDDERDRRRGAFDIEKNRLDARGRVGTVHMGAEGDMYDGPKQTGWNC